MIVFETFQPIRLAELVGGEERAGAIMGPVAAAGWAVFAVGAALAGWTSRRVGVARTAILARVLNGLGAVVMGLVAGPGRPHRRLLVTYLAARLGRPDARGPAAPRGAAAQPRHRALDELHGRLRSLSVSPRPLLGLLAEQTTTQVAMVAAGAFSVIGALFYLPARRAERTAESLAPQPLLADGTTQ